MSQQLEYDVATILNICSDGITDLLSDTLESICGVFKNASYSGHLLELDLIEIKLASQEISRDEAIEAVVEVIMTAGEECLNLIGVSVTPDISPQLMYKILDALVDFDVTEFPSTILNIVDASEDPIECVVNVLDFISSEESSVWYDNVEDVDVSFVENIRHVLLDAIDKLPPEILEIDKDLNKKRKLVKEIDPENQLVDYTTESSDLDTLLDSYSVELSKLSCEGFIKEVVALASIADGEPNKRLEAVDSIIEHRIDNPSERLRYNHFISKTKQSFEHIFFR